MENRERDILLAMNEFTYIQDLTKGDISMYVGPTKVSLSNTERIVNIDPTTKLVRPVIGEEGTQGVKQFVSASSSEYVVLENPIKKNDQKYARGPNPSTELEIGRKLVIPGPVSFPLWPGQSAEVVQGHRLKEDEYLVARVYETTPESDATIGHELIVKGTDTSFYIPPNGIEVLSRSRQANSKTYVLEAIKLQDGEYCTLKTGGKKRIVRGPSVVFPNVGETFDTKENKVIEKALPYKKEEGLHLYVLREFSTTERNDNTTELEELLGKGKFNTGQEIFIHGKEGIFFPSEELEVKGRVKPISLSKNEGIYVRNLEGGVIDTAVGPKGYLPDPTKEEIVERSLDEQVANLYGIKERDSRKAITIDVPPNHAAMVKNGEDRKVLQGPLTYVLGFTEELEILNLSTGKPKSDQTKLPTAFLQVEGNKVSDKITVETKEHVKLDVMVSYRISFTDDANKWFNVNDYVGLLCDHLGSVVRATVRTTPLETFYANSADIIRASVLGEKSAEGKRPGKKFVENWMHVYDLEVLDINLFDKNLEKLLVDYQQNVIEHELKDKEYEQKVSVERKIQQRNFDLETDKERLKQETLQLKINSITKEVESFEREREFSHAKLDFDLTLDKERKTRTVQNQLNVEKMKSDQELAYLKAKQDIELARAEADTTAYLQKIETDAKAYKEMASSVTPELIAAITRAGDAKLVSEAVKNLGELGLFKDLSTQEIMSKIFTGLPLACGGIEQLLLKARTTTEKK